MKAWMWALAAIAASVGAATIALRAPGVQDALFERAIETRLAVEPSGLLDGDGLKVVFCGTGSPLPSLKRAQACTAIIAGDDVFLVDAGTGSWEVAQLAGIPANRVAAIFLTHFHSDHIGDLSEVNLGTWVASRPAPLPVYGPEGVERVVAGVNEAYSLDSLYRTAHHGKAVAPPRTAGLDANAFDGAAAANVYEANGLRVTAFPVDHYPVSPAVGYRFDYNGRSVVISGDTAFSESLIEYARGADLLIHEAQANHMVARMSAAAAKAGRATTAKILADIPSYHTSPEDAARAAHEAEADWLVLTHLTPAPDNRIAKRMFMRGVSKLRAKKVRIAEDGMMVLLPAGGGVTFAPSG